MMKCYIFSEILNFYRGTISRQRLYQLLKRFGYVYVIRHGQKTRALPVEYLYDFFEFVDKEQKKFHNFSGIIPTVDLNLVKKYKALDYIYIGKYGNIEIELNRQQKAGENKMEVLK